jgi:mannose-6-phosphate isomerase
MGTHSSGPSKVIDDDKLLSEWLEEHPEAGGKYHTGLPFLFKVLSIQKALSIQVRLRIAHP